MMEDAAPFRGKIVSRQGAKHANDFLAAFAPLRDIVQIRCDEGAAIWKAAAPFRGKIVSRQGAKRAKDFLAAFAPLRDIVKFAAMKAPRSGRRRAFRVRSFLAKAQSAQRISWRPLRLCVT
jgi:hypothetical protein